MGFFKVVKFSAQAGLAGATVYYANEFNLFGGHKETKEGYEQLKQTVSTSEQYKAAVPYLNQVTEAVPSDVINANSMPSMTSSSLRQYWNCGVMATFSAIANLPETAQHYSQEASAFVSKQMEAATAAKPVEKEEKAAAKPVEKKATDQPVAPASDAAAKEPEEPVLAEKGDGEETAKAPENAAVEGEKN